MRLRPCEYRYMQASLFCELTHRNQKSHNSTTIWRHIFTLNFCDSFVDLSCLRTYPGTALAVYYVWLITLFFLSVPQYNSSLRKMDATESANVSVKCFENDIKRNRQDLTAIDWAYVGYDLFLAIGISLGNGLIIFIMTRERKLRTISNYLIMQLAISDFALGLMLVYHAAIYINRSLVIGPELCALRYVALLLPGSASLLGLLAISIDRYLAIMDPFRYQRIQTRRYFAAYAIGVWVPAGILGIVIPMAWHNKCPIECDFVLAFTRCYLLYFLIPLFRAITLPLTILCVHVLIKAKQQLRSIVDNEVVIPRKESPTYIKGQFKILKAGLAVIATFYAGWLPFFLILSIQVYTGTQQDSTLGLCRSFSMGLIGMNSMTNPLIYGYRLPDVKAELRKLFRISNNDVAPFQKTEIATR